jgi:hypothetical protein
MKIGAKGIQNLFNTFIVCDYSVEKKPHLKRHKSKGTFPFHSK